MAKKEDDSHEKERASAFTLMPAEFTATSRKRIEGFVNAQTALFDKLQESRQQWLVRMQSETELASELASKPAAAHSISEAMTAWQGWASRRLELVANDAMRLLDDTQRFVQIGTRLFAGDWLASTGASRQPH